jgi:hypothetical protein
MLKPVKPWVIALLGGGLLLATTELALGTSRTRPAGDTTPTSQPADRGSDRHRPLTAPAPGSHTPQTQPAHLTDFTKRQAARHEEALVIENPRREAHEMHEAHEMREAHERKEKSSEFAETRAARIALEEKFAHDPKVQAARQTVATAETALRAAVDAQVSATPQGKALLADAQKLHDILNDEQFEVRLNQVILAEYSNHLFGSDADLSALRVQAQHAERQLREIRRAEEENHAAAWMRRDEPVKPHNGPTPATAPLAQTGPAAPQGADEQAIKAYSDQLAARQAQNPTTAELLRKVAAADQAMRDTQIKIADLSKQLNEARAQAYQDASVAQAAQVARAATEALQQAMAPVGSTTQPSGNAAPKASSPKHAAGNIPNPNVVVAGSK